MAIHTPQKISQITLRIIRSMVPPAGPLKSLARP
jgi:hypothetical protein